MKISILTENTAGGNFLAEHGLSYLIEINGEQILFDTGHSDVFLKNAKLLGIDMDNTVKKVVLSHGHWDHGDGLRFIKNKTLLTHPAAFTPRFRKIDRSPVGLSQTKQQIEQQLTLIESKKPYQVSENLLFLGEIPRLNQFESKTTPFELECGSDDFIPDDSALIATENNVLKIITACSHSGICNICEYAKSVTGINKIEAIIGGFHLKKQNQQTRLTISYLKNNSVKTVIPTHCTDLPALSLFYNEFKFKQIKTGMVVKL